jgi:predicted nuclease with TOPRIM domain
MTEDRFRKYDELEDDEKEVLDAFRQMKLMSDYNKFKLKQIKNEVKEYIEYKEKISQIFKSKSIKTAMNRFNKLNEI